MGKIIGIGGCSAQTIIIRESGWWGCPRKCPAPCFWAGGSGWRLGDFEPPLTLAAVWAAYEEYAARWWGDGFVGREPRPPEVLAAAGILQGGE